MHKYRAAQLDGRKLVVTRRMVDAVRCDAEAVDALHAQIRQHCAILSSQINESIKNGQTPVFVVLDCSAVPFISKPMPIQKAISNFRQRIARDPKCDYYILHTDISQRELKHKYQVLSNSNGKYERDFSHENIDFYRYTMLNQLRTGALPNVRVLDLSLSISHMVMLPIEKRVMAKYGGEVLSLGNIGLRNAMNDDFQLELLTFLRDSLCVGSQTFMLSNDKALAQKCAENGVPCMRANRSGQVYKW